MQLMKIQKINLKNENLNGLDETKIKWIKILFIGSIGFLVFKAGQKKVKERNIEFSKIKHDINDETSAKELKALESLDENDKKLLNNPEMLGYKINFDKINSKYKVQCPDGSRFLIPKQSDAELFAVMHKENKNKARKFFKNLKNYKILENKDSVGFTVQAPPDYVFEVDSISEANLINDLHKIDPTEAIRAFDNIKRAKLRQNVKDLDPIS